MPKPPILRFEIPWFLGKYHACRKDQPSDLSRFKFEGHFYDQSPSYSWISEIQLQIIGSPPSEQKKVSTKINLSTYRRFFRHFSGAANLRPSKSSSLKVDLRRQQPFFDMVKGFREEKGARKTGMNMKPLPENSFGIPILFKTYSLQKSKCRMHDFKEKLLLLYVQHHIHH